MSSRNWLYLAYQILTCDHLKLRRKVIKEGISVEEFFSLSTEQVLRLGLAHNQLAGFTEPIVLAQKEYSKAKESNITITFPSCPDYPESLRHIFDPPQCLYMIGTKPDWNASALAVVGSRKPSPYGTQIMASYLPKLASAGLLIISGMAYGIDTLAHTLTLARDGKTVGVNAGGLMHLYPPGNRSLIAEIASRGCIVSEFPLQTIPRPYHFPIRNRIIAGLSQKVWIVEAAERSGSLITARLALENNRDVLSTPGPVNSPTSMGTNRLIRDGAKPVLSVNDILEEFGIHIIDEGEKRKTLVMGDREIVLLDLLKENGVKDIDFLVEKSALPVHVVVSILNGLLLQGIVAANPGGTWNINE